MRNLYRVPSHARRPTTHHIILSRLHSPEAKGRQLLVLVLVLSGK